MKCLECGADIYEGVKKCPYCKAPTTSAGNNEKFNNFDFKYTITSADQMEKIRESVKSASKARKKEKEGIKVKLEKYLAKRRAAKRAAKRAVRRGEDPKIAVQKLEAKDSTDPFIKDTAVPETENDSLGTYKRVKTVKPSGKSSDHSRKKSSGMAKKKKTGNKNNQNIVKQYVRCGVLVAVAALVIYLVVLFFGWLFGSDAVGAYAYAKDNALCMVYDGENITLSKNVICEEYIRKLNDMENPPSVDSIIKNENVVHTSRNGEITYFFENYDPDTDCGRLKVIIGGELEKVVTISESAHNSISLSGEGNRILYLRALETESQAGVLHFWEEGCEEPLKIVTDIDPYSYQFSRNGEWAMFLQNYRRNEKSGDLYAINVEEPEEGKQKVDSDVYKLFGSDSKGEYHIYGKEYDTSNGTFDIYAVGEDGQTKRLGEKTDKEPWLMNKDEYVFILGVDDDGKNNTYNLYSVEVSSGKKNKIDSGVSSICMLSDDEETVIYEKVYNEEVSDYYAYIEGELPSKIAPNLIVNKDIVGDNRQFSATADCEQFLYISSFMKNKEGGKLIYCEYDGVIEDEKVIAEDVRSCYVTEDDIFVFTKNYSVTRNCFDVYALENGEERLLKEEVIPEKFDVDSTCNYIYFISNYNVEGDFGTLERMDLDGDSEVIADKVHSFVITPVGDVLVKKNFNSGKNTFDLYLIEEGDNEAVEVNNSVSELLQP